MELKQLFDMQRTLDERIIKQHYLEGKDLFEQRILALNVELAELAQETRCFKFWSMIKRPSARVLDELVDVLHFLLSVGLELEMDSSAVEHIKRKTIEEVESTPISQDKSSVFNALFYSVSELKRSSFFLDYHIVFDDFVILYTNLGFTWEQVTQAYMEKNKENHDRQDRGY